MELREYVVQVNMIDILMDNVKIKTTPIVIVLILFFVFLLIKFCDSVDRYKMAIINYMH
jgi:hypothetical protein